MEVKRENQNGKVKLTISVEVAEVKKVVDDVYERLSKNVKVAGFRPGKAPRHLIEKEIGQERLNTEILDTIIPDTYYQAVIKENLNVVGAPEIKLLKFVPTDGLTYEAAAELMPEIKLPDLAKIKIKREEIKLNPKEIDEVLQDLAKQLAKTAKIDRPAKLGDRADINFEGFIDNAPFEGGKSNNYPLILGQGRLAPGFEEQLVGMKSGEEKEIKITFPKDYHSTDFADKEAKFKIKINELEEIIMPDITDEFASKIGPFANLKELRKDIEKQLEITKKVQERNRVENEIFEKLLEKIEIQPPESLAHQEVHRLLHEAEHNLANQDMTMERYLAMTKKTKEDLEKELQPEAEKRVKIGLILTQVAKEIKVEATNQEISTEVIKRTESLSSDEKKKAKDFYDSSEGRQQTENTIIGQKVVDYLYETCSK